MALNSKIPSGPLENKWEKHKFEMKLVNPANKRKDDGEQENGHARDAVCDGNRNDRQFILHGDRAG